MSTTRVVLLGTGGVGKSAIAIQFVKGEFVADYDPTIEENHRRTFDVDGRQVTLDICDTAGMADLSSLRDSAIKAGDGFIFVYSIAERATFERLTEVHEDVILLRNETTVPCVVCGNKCDLADRREVPSDEGRAWAEQAGAKFFETSAKEVVNITEAFCEVVREIRRRTAAQEPPKPAPEKKRCLLL